LTKIIPGSYIRKKQYVGYLILENERKPVEQNGLVTRSLGDYSIKGVGKSIEVLWNDGTFTIEFSSMVEEVFN